MRHFGLLKASSLGDEMLNQVISDFLAADTPQVLCVRGPWGVGKTFAWRLALQAATKNGTLKTDRYSYVSLFGIDSVNSMRSSILENLEYLSNDQAAKWFGRNTKHAAKFVPAIATLLGQSDLASAAGALAFSVVRNQIVCIDDIERRHPDLPLQDVFGLASFLQESRGCRVVILLNEDQLGDSADIYRKYFEKVVSNSVRYSPTPAAVSELAIPSDGKLSELLRRDCASLGISNIRLIQRASKLANDAAKHATETHPLVLRDISHSCAFLTWVYYEGEGAPSIDYVRKYNDPDFDLGVSSEATDEHKRWDERIGAYGWGALDDLDRALLDRLANGFFDETFLLSAITAKSEQHAASERAEQLSAAWNKFHESFDDNAEEIATAFSDAYRVNRADLTPSSVDGIVRMLRQVGRGALADEIANEYVSSLPDGAEAYDLEKINRFQPIRDPLIQQLLQLRQDATKPAPDILEVLRRLAGRSGWSQETLDALAAYSPSDYERVFRSLRGDELSSIVDACLQFQNISNADQSMNKIVDSAKQALVNIGRDNPLNAARLEKFGLRV